MKKLFIISIFLTLFLIGCTTLPFNVAICGNEICESEEEKICPSDCVDTTKESDSAATDSTTSTTSDTGDSQTADSSTDSTSGTTDTSSTNTTGNTTDTTDSSTTGTTGTADTSSSSGDGDDDDDEIVYDTQEGVSCEHSWDCTDWNPCEENGMQTRICYYTGTCSVEEGQPDTRQLCTYTAPKEAIVPVERTESCYDSIQNQGERGTDCGGPCTACQTPTPIAEQPAPTWPYILLGIGLLLFITGIILYHKYKDKIKEYWNTVKMKFTKKPQKPLTPLQPPPKFSNQQQYQVNQQYPRYR